MAIAGLLVDRPVGWNIDEGDLGYLGAAAYGVVISCVGILEWYLISTLLAVPYLICRVGILPWFARRWYLLD